MEKFFQDVRFALRVYKKHKSFTLIAMLVLSVGIGSNIAVFTVVNAMLFRSLPYPDAEHLVQVGRSLNKGPAYPMSYARFRFLEKNNRVFESLAAYDVVGSSLSVTLGETPELLQSSRVSADFFKVLGVNPMLGRGFQLSPVSFCLLSFCPMPREISSWRRIGEQLHRSSLKRCVSHCMQDAYLVIAIHPAHRPLRLLTKCLLTDF